MHDERSRGTTNPCSSPIAIDRMAASVAEITHPKKLVQMFIPVFGQSAFISTLRVSFEQYFCVFSIDFDSRYFSAFSALPASHRACFLFSYTLRAAASSTNRTHEQKRTNKAPPSGHRLFLSGDLLSSEFCNMENSTLSSPFLCLILILCPCMYMHPVLKLVSTWRKGRRCALQEKKVEMQEKRILFIPRCKPHYYGLLSCTMVRVGGA